MAKQTILTAPLPVEEKFEIIEFDLPTDLINKSLKHFVTKLVSPASRSIITEQWIDNPTDGEYKVNAECILNTLLNECILQAIKQELLLHSPKTYSPTDEYETPEK